MISLLIKNAIIVTVNPQREIIWNGAIAINDDTIIDLGDSEIICEKYPQAKEVIDATNKIIFPGLINTHNHLVQTLLRGLGDDIALPEWLNTLTTPVNCCLTEEDCYYGAMLGGIESLHSGVTTNLDFMYAHPVPNLSDAILKAFKELNIRSIYARSFIDNTTAGLPEKLVQDPETIEQDCRRLFETYHNSNDGLIKVWVGPSAMWSCTKETMVKMWNLTNEYGGGFTTHISEGPFPREKTRQLHGFVDTELCEELGIVGPNVLLVHCIDITEKDIDMMKKYDMKVSHNTVCNMYLASGVAPIPKMLKSGVTVSLGLDGAASNNSQDMIENMKCTALLHKVSNLDPKCMTAEKVLEMATIDGARSLGLDKEVGSLEINKKADLFIFNPYLSAKSIPMHNPVSTLIYSSSMENVETVIINGKIVLKDKKIPNFNYDNFLKKAQEVSDDLATRAKVTNRREGHVWKSILE
jgi:5-methylthioadenosine/S-adenosylhomocysteine deaminase